LIRIDSAWNKKVPFIKILRLRIIWILSSFEVCFAFVVHVLLNLCYVDVWSNIVFISSYMYLWYQSKAETWTFNVYRSNIWLVANMFNDFFLTTSILCLNNILSHLCTLPLCRLMFTFPFVWTGLIWIIDFNSTSNNSSIYIVTVNKGNNQITELRTIFQMESKNS